MSTTPEEAKNIVDELAGKVSDAMKMKGIDPEFDQQVFPLFKKQVEDLYFLYDSIIDYGDKSPEATAAKFEVIASTRALLIGNNKYRQSKQNGGAE